MKIATARYKVVTVHGECIIDNVSLSLKIMDYSDITEDPYYINYLIIKNDRDIEIGRFMLDKVVYWIEEEE